MQCRTNRIQCWRPRHAFGTCLAFGVFVLIAATALGQQKSAKPPRPVTAPKTAVEMVPSPDEQTIRQALQVTSNFGFNETPLKDVVDHLKGLTKQEFQFDNKALENANIRTDTPITFSARGISAQSAMRLMLHNLDLTWIIKDSVVLITTAEEAENQLITKVYPVYDLIAPRPSFRFEGMYVPGMSKGEFPRTTSTTTQNVSGMSGSVGGSIGGGMGGGMFSVPDNSQPANVKRNTANASPEQSRPSGTAASGRANTHQTPSSGQAGVGQGGSCQMTRSSENEPTFMMDMDELIEVLTATVKPTTWVDVGGPGSIMSTGGMLVISQTQEAHEEIEKLLASLRAVSPGLRVVTIRATWLQLNLDQLDQLLRSKPGKEGGIDRKALSKMAAETTGYIGTITCLNGQTVHIASGRSRSAITSVVPVVGGGEEGPGYQPVISSPQSGGLLQVTPQLLPNTLGAMLDLCSSVTRSGPPETIRFLTDKAAASKKTGENATTGPSITLDRVNMVVSQLATTLKVPLGEPTLVGGLTTEAADGDQSAADTPQLYLFIEANAK